MRIFLFVFLLVSLLNATARAEGDKLRVLILDGQNNHGWAETSNALRGTLLQTGRFEVTVSTTPVSYRETKAPPRRPRKDDAPAVHEKYEKDQADWKAREKTHNENNKAKWAEWRPNFSTCDVVVNNYNGPDWPQEVREAFVAFVQNGGGVVNVHAANNGFRGWDDFNAMIGLGWRPALNGAAIAFDNAGNEIRTARGEGENSGHGSKHRFTVAVRKPEHPIMKGIPAEWLHGADELYHRMRGNPELVEVLSTAFSEPEKQGGTGNHEPVTWTTRFGEGRVVTTIMGHYWWDGASGARTRESLHCVGFQTIVARSAEWAATGKVTLDLPSPFPTKEDVALVHPESLKWTAGGKVIDEVTALPVKERWKAKKERNPYGLLSPEESAASIELPDGYRLELAVSEPHIAEPVLAVFDGNGNLYVAEMRSYMQDEYGNGTKTLRNGRVSRHEDTNGDGTYDRHTVFIDKLNLPRMLLPLDDRIAVVETDTLAIHSYRDTDGDGVADEKKLLAETTRTISPERSVEHQQAGLLWSLDNWVYLSRGESRYRWDHATETFQREPLMGVWNQWGLDQDDTGRLFYSDNSTPGEGFQQHPIYLERSKKHAKMSWSEPRLGEDYPPEFMTMHTICKHGDRGESHAYGAFTSATGHSLYRGDALPDDVNGNFFVCDPTGHVVRRARVEDHEGHLQLVNVYEEEKGEFLRSSDINFRPVNTMTGPDGSFYVVDMYRGIIQDAPWVNDGMKKFLRNTGLSLNHSHGRIWRVVHESKKPAKPLRLLDMKNSELVEQLSHSNGWVRDMAQRQLVLRNDTSEETISLLQNVSSPLGRVHALWALEGLNKLRIEDCLVAISADDSRIRATGLRLSESFLEEDASRAQLLEAAAKLAGDSDPEVRRQLILSLGFSEDPKAMALVEKAARHDLTDARIFLATMTTLYGRKDHPLVVDLLSGTAFASIENKTARSMAAVQWQSGIASWGKGLSAGARKLAPEEAERLAHGAELFNMTCATCHGPNGKGLLPPGAELALAPTLVGSDRVIGNKERLTRLVLNGLTGPVDGKHYEAGIMVPVAALGLVEDKDIADVLSYVRQSWGNTADFIQPDEIAAIRESNSARVTPWTLEELETYQLPWIKDRSSWTATASHGDAKGALDGAGGRCDIPNKPGTWFQIDLGSKYEICGVRLEAKNPQRFPRGIEVVLSDDGKEWSKPVVTAKGWRDPVDASFEPVASRYVRIRQTGTSDHRWSVGEIQIQGKSQ